MISINSWFTQNAKKPLLILGVIVLGIQAAFILFHISSNQKERSLRISNLVHKIGNTGIEQKNRDIIESTFSVAVEELGAKQIFLCQKNQIIVGFPYSVGDCTKEVSHSWLDRQITIQPSGYSDYKYVFLLPRWSFSSAFVGVLLLTSASVLIFFSLLFRLQSKMRIEVIEPLQKQMFTDEPIKIKELDKLRSSIVKAKEDSEKAAILKAKRESEAKFIHNVQSPLGNLRLLKDRILNQVDSDSATLLESVVADISGLTATYAAQSTGVESSSENRTALVDLVDAVENVVRTKVLEFGKSKQPIRINFDYKIKEPVFIKASLVELRSIISNMLNNAVDAGASAVEIEFSRKENLIQIFIKDNGTGVEPSIQDKIFDKDVSFGKAHGTGYGLYHAKKFISLWSGKVKLLNSSSEGSTFKITLPLVELPEIKIESHHQVIILEDDEKVRKRLKATLQQKFDDNLKTPIEFSTTTATLDWFEKTDLMMADVRLFADNDLGEGQKTGFELIRDLGIGDISLLVTNSYGDADLANKCRLHGVRLLPKVCLEQHSL